MATYMPVRFVRQLQSYTRGDVATFPPERANALVKAGIAERYEAPEPTPKKAKRQKPEPETQF